MITSFRTIFSGGVIYISGVRLTVGSQVLRCSEYHYHFTIKEGGIFSFALENCTDEYQYLTCGIGGENIVSQRLWKDDFLSSVVLRPREELELSCWVPSGSAFRVNRMHCFAEIEDWRNGPFYLVLRGSNWTHEARVVIFPQTALPIYRHGRLRRVQCTIK